MRINIGLPKPGLIAAAGKQQLAALRRASQQGVHEAGQKAYRRVQAEIRAAGLGNLSKNVGFSSSLRKGTNNPDHAYAVLFAKGEDQKTRGAQALQAYSAGASIYPKHGQWLAFATDALKRTSGFGRNRERLTPQTYVKFGFDKRLGPLIFKRVNSSHAVLFVTGADIARKNGLAVAKGKRASKARISRKFVVMFLLIRFTTRAARFDQNKATAYYSSRVPAYIDAILRKATV